MLFGDVAGETTDVEADSGGGGGGGGLLRSCLSEGKSGVGLWVVLCSRRGGRALRCWLP